MELARECSGAASHDVRFGTANPPPFVVNQTATTYDPGAMTAGTTYYWRIDEIDFLGNATVGTVWKFRTRHLAFPGAEGYGRFARGGRGGKVKLISPVWDRRSQERRVSTTHSSPSCS